MSSSISVKLKWADRWLEEMVADTFGVLLGGAGYVYSLMTLLFNTTDDVVASSGMGVHPNSYVRIFLLGALLRATGVGELAVVASDVETRWREFYPESPAFLSSFLSECSDVAEGLLHQPLATLEEKCLHDFARHNEAFPDAPDCARDHERIVALSNHFRKLDTRPASDSSWIRLVPAAAQLAVRNTNKEVAKRLPEIHAFANGFLRSLPRPQFLAPEGSATHSAFLDRLIERLDFSG